LFFANVIKIACTKKATSQHRSNNNFEPNRNVILVKVIHESAFEPGPNTLIPINKKQSIGGSSGQSSYMMALLPARACTSEINSLVRKCSIRRFSYGYLVTT